MKSTWKLAWSLVFFSAASVAQSSELIFEHGAIRVYKSADAKAADFKDLYFVNTDTLNFSRADLEKYGDVMDFQKGIFAVMRLEGANVAKLSGRLHHAGLACGVLFKLRGDLVSKRKIVDPVPVISVTTKLEEVSSSGVTVSADNIKATVEDLSAIFTRFHSTATGQAVAEHMMAKYRALAQGREDVTIDAFDHGSETPQNSFVVKIRGTTRPDEIIILGSHIDSVNWQDGQTERAPGSDDNASGTATNLEIFRILMEKNIHLERTLEIHGYAAEELGLVGSQDMATKYEDANKNVIAMVQHDMDLYGTGPDKIWFVSNGTNASLNSQLSTLVRQYQTVAQGTGNLSGGDSDHTSWARAGYASSFPFENPQAYNHKIHSADDNIANSGKFTQAAEFAKLGLAYVMHFGGLVR